MELKQAKHLIERAVQAKELLIIIGNCRAEYTGRAVSQLRWGQRMLLAKADQSFAIHQNKHLRPVNYMMDAGIAVAMNDKELIITVSKSKPKEILKVFLDKIEDVKSYALEDQEDVRLTGSESQISHELMQDLSFIEPGLKPVNQEVPFRKGVVDILAEDSKGRLVVIEVKRRQADFDSVTQLERYMKQVQKIKARQTRGILIAPSIGKNALELLERSGLEFAKLEFEMKNPKTTIKGVQKKQKEITEYFKE